MPTPNLANAAAAALDAAETHWGRPTAADIAAYTAAYEAALKASSPYPLLGDTLWAAEEAAEEAYYEHGEGRPAARIAAAAYAASSYAATLS